MACARPLEDNQNAIRTPQTDAKIFLEAGAATRPVPRGAGMRRTLTLPQVPESFMGIVCGSPLFLLCRIDR